MDLIKMPGVTYCEFAKNEYIIRQGERLEFAYYLLDGVCYRKAVTEKGDEIIYSVKKSEGLLVQALLGILILYSDGVSRSDFQAQTKCRCYKIPKEVLFQYMQDKPALLLQMLRMAMGELQRLSNLFQGRLGGRTANQLCALLLKNARHINGALVVNKEHSNREISQFLGVHQVTAARILRVLKKEGIIDRDKGGIIILDEKRLSAYAKGADIIGYR